MKIEAVRLSCKRDPVWAKEARDRGASNGDLIVRAGGRVFHCYEINVGRERPSTGFRVDRRGHGLHYLIRVVNRRIRAPARSDRSGRDAQERSSAQGVHRQDSRGGHLTRVRRGCCAKMARHNGAR